MVAPQVKEGTIDVDQSALTGESLPVTLRGGDAAQMGATVVRGETHAIGEDALCAPSPCLVHRACLSTNPADVMNTVSRHLCMVRLGGICLGSMCAGLMFACSGTWTVQSPLSMYHSHLSCVWQSCSQ